MTGYLLDTSVLSAFAPGRSAPGHVRDWMLRHSAEFHLSVVTLIEVHQGIRKLTRTGQAAKAADLEAWLEKTATEFGRNVVAIDSELAPAIGAMVDHAIAIGRNPGLADLMLAATAQARRMRLLTRNLRHFTPLGIDAADPFATPT